LTYFEDKRGHSAIPKFDEGFKDIQATFATFNEISKDFNIEFLDIKLFSLVKIDSDLNIFKPRNDNEPYTLTFPLDWSTDPFNDRNWCYQLHAWRMMDSLFFKYEESKNHNYLISCIDVMLDWENYTILQDKKTEMTWNDMATGLRALKIGYIINRLLIEDKHIEPDYIDNLIRLAKIHIEELINQKISLNNHGIFQVHGLMILSWILKDNKSMEYALKWMNILLKQQFYEEGFHSENSDDYHWFIFKTFDDILKFPVYQQNKDIATIILNATNCKAWTVFPNNQSLVIGDSSDSIRNVKIPTKNTDDYFVKFFKESGFFFVRSSFKTDSINASMLFLQTAYKNKSHRHADDFNILLYEFGKNILVDSGKYSYEEKSLQRLYCRSTYSHNCLQIDKKNYEYKGEYYYDSAVKEYDEKDGVFIVKTSLQRKDFEVLHDRLILYKPKEFLVVIDKMKSAIERSYNQIWHFHQDLEISKENNLFKTEINENNKMKIIPMVYKNDSFVINDNVKLIKGQTEPYMQGWRSLKYREMIPNYALENEVQAKNSLLVTKFLFNDNDISIDVLKNDLILKSDKLNIDLNIDVS